MANKKTCPVCGKLFVVKNGKKNCSDKCRKLGKDKGKSERRKLIGELTLEQVQARCNAEGMTYGQYMAKHYWS